MRKLLLLVIIFFVSGLPSVSLAQEKGISQTTLNIIHEYVTEQFNNNRVIGGAYAITQEGKVIAAKGIGIADVETKEPVTPETVYATASVTKAFTAAAILQLAEQGQIDLDAPVNTYIPWFTYKDRDRSAKVTIRHLLTHSAGIQRLEADGSIFQNERENRNSLEKSVRALSTVSMTADPGTEASYCNTCYNTLGLVIEKVTQTDYEQYMKEHIFAPLGMDHTAFDPTKMDHVASEYMWLFGLKHKSAPNVEVFGHSQNPEGGIYSNVLDLSKFLAAMLGEGPELLRPETLQTSQQGEISTGSDGSFYSISGFEEGSRHQTRILYKAGDGIGSTAMVVMIPEMKVGISLLIGDSIPEIGQPLAFGIADILLGKKPSDVHVGITFWRLLGSISLGLVIIGIVLLVLLVRSIFLLQHPQKPFRRGWTICRTVLCIIILLPIVYLLITVHPTQIGFYGYPQDLAVGLFAIMISLALWVVYSLIALIAIRK
ncbi:serine hydrolase [Paenibacillus barengoltzii]|uniref:serine hydrolase n=1 Tax=Paenibacillus TaxID=44249 RepID=UPI00048F03EC|nr:MULTISPECIES: serine hydrolase [Paenibacillus]MEC2342596.1 serine hydrolase [Paenibacillus barengoltzii]